MPVVGVLRSGAGEPFNSTFRSALAGMGYVDGRNIRYLEREAMGSGEDLDALAEELVRAQVDVIVALAPPAAVAAKRATRSIPVVAVAIGDPVASGLVTSLARPEGNVTGSTRMLTEMSVKHVELLKQMAPGTSRLAVMFNPANSSHPPALRAIEAAARPLGIEVRPYEVRGSEALSRTLPSLPLDRANGLAFLADPEFGSQQAMIAKFALENRIPSICNYTEFPKAGGLAGYAPDILDEFRSTAEYVDRILKGAKPGDLPVRQPVTFELVVNLRTARTLGLRIPAEVLVRANQVIE